MDLFDEDAFEFFNTKEYKKDMILSIHGIHRNVFSDAIKERIINLKNEIKAIDKKITQLNSQLSQAPEPVDKDFDIYDEMGSLAMDLDWSQEQLHALNEMRVIYLFKNIEIEMKSLIRTAYPKINTGSLYNWDNMKLFFEEKDIKLTTITGYNEVYQLKQINNNLKHSDIMSEANLKTLGFKVGESWDSTKLERFCKKIEPKIEAFKKELAEEVVKELYEFSDFKLDTLTSELHERMDKNDAEEFIKKMKNKFSI